MKRGNKRMEGSCGYSRYTCGHTCHQSRYACGHTCLQTLQACNFAYCDASMYLSEKHCAYIIGLINRAFDHDFSEDEEIRFACGHAFEIGSDAGRRYSWSIRTGIDGRDNICLFEYEPADETDAIICTENAMYMRFPSVAVIKPNSRCAQVRTDFILETAVEEVVYPIPIITTRRSGIMNDILQHLKRLNQTS